MTATDAGGFLQRANPEGARWDTAITAEAEHRARCHRVRRAPNIAKIQPISTPSSAKSGRSSSEVPGTTRDAIDARLAWGRGKMVLMDSAGIHSGKVSPSGAAARKR